MLEVNDLNGDCGIPRSTPRIARRPPIGTIPSVQAPPLGPEALPFVRRDVGIMLAVREGQYSLTSIANALELSTSRVSRIVGAQDQAKDEA